MMESELMCLRSKIDELEMKLGRHPSYKHIGGGTQSQVSLQYMESIEYRRESARDKELKEYQDLYEASRKASQ